MQKKCRKTGIKSGYIKRLQKCRVIVRRVKTENPRLLRMCRKPKRGAAPERFRSSRERRKSKMR